MEYQYAVGSTLVDAGRLEDALGVLDEASGYPAICLRHLIRGQFEEAGHALGSIADRAELAELAELAVDLGLERLSGGEVAAAEGIWQLLTVAGDDDGRAVATAFLAVLREDLGDPHGALRAWQQTATPAAECWRRFGLACASAGESERGRRALERAVQLGRDGSNDAQRRSAAEAAHPLGYLAYEADDRAAAVAAFAVSAAYEHVDRFDRVREAGQNMLVLFRELHGAGEHEQAVESLRRLVESGHQATAVTKAEQSGQAAEEAGELTVAVRYYRAIAEFGKPAAAAAAGLQAGHLLAKLERGDEADALFAQVAGSGVPEFARLAEFSRYALASGADQSAADEILRRLVDGPDGELADVAQAGAEEPTSQDAGAAAEEPEPGDGPEGTEALARYLYGRRLAEQGDTDRAVELYRQVYDGGGEWAAAAAMSLGVRANESGDTARACEWWLRAVDDEGEAGENSIQNLGVVHKQEQRYAEAEKWWLRLMDSYPHRRAEAAAHIGEMHWWVGEKQQAAQWYRITLDESEEPEYVGEAAYRTGDFLSESGQHETARELLTRAVGAGFEPFASSASRLLDELEPSPAEEPPAAESPAQASGAGDPEADGSEGDGPDVDGPEAEDPVVSFVQARRLQEEGETERAIVLFRQVWDHGGDWAGPSALSLGAIADRNGDPEQARSWWLSAVEDPSVCGNALMNLAVVAKRDGELAEAHRWFERLMAVDADRQAECAAHIGEMLYWQGDRQAAAQWYRITLSESEQPGLVGEAAYRTAEWQVESGGYEVARELLIRTVEAGAEPFASSASDLLRQLATAAPVEGDPGVPAQTDTPPSDAPPAS